MTSLTSQEARDAVNVFASVDVLSLLEYGNYPGATPTIEAAIKDHYKNIRGMDPDLLTHAMKKPLQEWDMGKQKYKFSGAWSDVVAKAKTLNPSNYYKKFASTSGTQSVLGKFVQLVANRCDTQGGELAVNEADLIPDGGTNCLSEAHNLRIKAKPAQWIRWWGNSITPFSDIQCVIGNITRQDRPSDLPELQYQQDVTVSYSAPSGQVGQAAPDYSTATQTAFSRMGQLKPDNAVGKKIRYDIKFNLVDPEGDTIACFQVDPEILVISG